MRVAVNQAGPLFNARIADLFSWDPAEQIQWLSPVAEDGYAEYFDEAFVDLLRLPLKVPLASFWPSSGPRWDGLARTASGKAILIEAKAYIEEAVDYSSQASPQSLSKIELALEQTKAAFGAASRAPWSTPFYQYANRLAHLHFLAGINGLGAYLLFVYFTDAPDVEAPCSEAEWHGAIRIVHKALGIPQRHPYSARIGHLLMPVGDLHQPVPHRSS